MIVWLSSYPRSGNTFFRVILNSIFNIKTYSIYNDTGDIGADEATSEVVGHTFLPEGFNLEDARNSDEIWYIKTHELRNNMQVDERDKVIYLVRDGRASSLSFTKHLQNFYGKKDDDLSDVLYGDTPYGSWGEHVMQWKDTPQLLIKFETLVDTPEKVIEQIGQYLDIEPKGGKIPTFEELQKINPKFFRSGKKDGWKSFFSKEDHLLFWVRNKEPMYLMGYSSDVPEEVNSHAFDPLSDLFEKTYMLHKEKLRQCSKEQQKLHALEEELSLCNHKLQAISTSTSFKIGRMFMTPYWYLKNRLKK